MAKYLVDIVYHKAFTKTKLIYAKSLEDAQEQADDLAAAMEQRKDVVIAEVNSISEDF